MTAPVHQNGNGRVREILESHEDRIARLCDLMEGLAYRIDRIELEQKENFRASAEIAGRYYEDFSRKLESILEAMTDGES